MAATDRGFTVQLGSDWEALAKMHVRVPRPWARMGLKPEDLGFLTWLLSHKPNQPLSARFAAQGLSCSPDRIEAICKRLEARDILIRRRERDDAGRLRGAIWELIPPPEFRELARALAAAQGEPEPEFPGLDTTSENTAHAETKPQVGTYPEKTRSGKTRSGKSGTKEVQGKGNSGERNTHPATVGDLPPRGKQGPVCVDEFRDDADAAIRGAIDQEANLRLDRPDREVLVARITVLMQRGWTKEMVQSRLSGRTNSGTRRPDVILGRALDALEAEEPPTGRAANADRAFALQEALDRAAVLLRDHDQELVRVTSWLNTARPAEVTGWMDQSDEEILAAVDVTPTHRNPAPAQRTESTRSTGTSQLRREAAERAVELGAPTEAAQQWAAGRKSWELLRWLEAEETDQRESLPIAA
ncbi:hypothetical protein STBA_71620 [Streptomyces sp. MP131-18]|nr:hypothetical protein STBA_71620 [Streptomyces sp. MP131-18]